MRLPFSFTKSHPSPILLYLDNKLKASIPYGQYYRTVLDLKALGLSEQDRTLSYRKNIMVKFNQNGELYTKMGVCFTSAGLPSGHIKGRLIDKIRPLPLKTSTCLTDHNKNVTGLADDQGHIVATWDYDAFGNIIRQTGPMASSNPLRFSSEYHDEDLGLIYYNYRHYNPKDGRWISRDPIEEKGGFNLYSFINNFPLTRFDGLGLMEYGMGAISNGTFGHSNPSLSTCKEKRKNTIAKLTRLVNSHNYKEPKCGEGCTLITVYVNISDPCDTFPYGHAGIGIDSEYSDMGPWSMLWPSMRPWHARDTRMTSVMDEQSCWTNPTVSIRFCACHKRATKIKDYWKNLNNILMNRPVRHRYWWTPWNNCATAVADSLGVAGISIPDDLLENIDSNFSNECGNRKGMPPTIKLIRSNFPEIE